MQSVKVNTKASYPMSYVATDLFQIGSNDYISLVDRYSGWLMCAKLRSKTTESVGLAHPTMYNVSMRNKKNISRMENWNITT